MLSAGLVVLGLLTEGAAVPAVLLLHLTPAGLHQHPAVAVTLTRLPGSAVAVASPPSLSPSVMAVLTGVSVPGGVPQSHALDVPPQLLLRLAAVPLQDVRSLRLVLVVARLLEVFVHVVPAVEVLLGSALATLPGLVLSRPGSALPLPLTPRSSLRRLRLRLVLRLVV